MNKACSVIDRSGGYKCTPKVLIKVLINDNIYIYVYIYIYIYLFISCI